MVEGATRETGMERQGPPRGRESKQEGRKPSRVGIASPPKNELLMLFKDFWMSGDIQKETLLHPMPSCCLWEKWVADAWG